MFIHSLVLLVLTTPSRSIYSLTTTCVRTMTAPACALSSDQTPRTSTGASSSSTSSFRSHWHTHAPASHLWQVEELSFRRYGGESGLAQETERRDEDRRKRKQDAYADHVRKVCSSFLSSCCPPSAAAPKADHHKHVAQARCCAPRAPIRSSIRGSAIISQTNAHSCHYAAPECAERRLGEDVPAVRVHAEL